MLDGWRPIESAPKDIPVLVWDGGAFFLMLCDVYGPTICHPNNPSGDMQRKEAGINECLEWRDDSGDSYQDWHPSHWMPLPPPPLSLQEEK